VNKDQKLLQEAYELIIERQLILNEHFNITGIASSISDIKKLIDNNKNQISSKDNIVKTILNSFEQITSKYDLGEGERKCVLIGVHEEGVIDNTQYSDLMKYFSSEDKQIFRRF